MDKNEILNKYKAEGIDEGRDHVNEQGDLMGHLAMCLLALALIVYKTVKHLPIGDILAILFAFLAVGLFYRYRLSKEKSTLLFAVITGIICLGCLTWFIATTL